MNPEPWTTFLVDRLPELWLRLGQHLALTGTSTGLAILIGIPSGILAARGGHLRGGILAAAEILQTIPSLAMLTLLLALLHRIGAVPAIIALTLYALLPIVRNTITGLEGVAEEVLEAAEGIGMTGWQRLWMVRLPLALPVMMAGIRTAAVISIGIATLSAFIGAGGLGQFINRGLALANTRLILLGAIPAAVLALLVDMLLGVAGWALDPLRGADRSSKKRNLLRWVAVLFPVILFGAGAVGYIGARPDVVIGSKNFTEQLILGHILADMIEADTDLRVDRRFCLGGTMICHGALAGGEIDLYPEYTGTGLTTVLHEQPDADADRVFDTVSRRYLQEFDVRWLAPFGINNTYAIAVRKADASKHGWRSISDLKSQAPRLTAGLTAEFGARPDGYRGFRKMYGFRFGRVVDIDAGLMYDALAEGAVDVIAAFATDGRIAAYDLILLEDDRHYFPPYAAAPVVREQTLQEFPVIGRALGKLAGVLDDQTMQRLNLQVDQHKQSPEHVARTFLQSRGLIPRQ